MRLFTEIELSITLMTAAFKADLPTTQKFVLVALCDAANDQGECYPSVPTLMSKCSLSDRGVQKAIGELARLGFLSREQRSGRSTVYTVKPSQSYTQPPNHVHPRTTFTPNDVHPTPEQCSPPPPNVVHPAPERRSPITIKEPSIEPSGNQRKKPSASVPVSVLVAAGFDDSGAQEFIAYKTSVRAPLTARAWDDHLREAQKAGWSPLQAAEKVMAKSWKGFEAKYVAAEAPARGTGPPAETAYARSMREKYEQVTPHIAARQPGARRLNPMEILDGLTSVSGGPDIHEVQPDLRPRLPLPLGGPEPG